MSMFHIYQDIIGTKLLECFYSRKILTVLLSLKIGIHSYICILRRSETAFPTSEKHFHFCQTTFPSFVEQGWPTCSSQATSGLQAIQL